MADFYEQFMDFFSAGYDNILTFRIPLVLDMVTAYDVDFEGLYPELNAFPSRATSPLQPMNQAVIRIFEKYYSPLITDTDGTQNTLFRNFGNSSIFIIL